MTRSKIFLGLTTTCLAIAGVVAAKATHFTKAAGFYITSGGAGCPAVSNTNCVLDATSSKICKTADFGLLTYYTYRTWINPSNHSLGTKCQHPLKYTNL